MADEVDDPNDPLRQLIERHVKRMQEIQYEGFSDAKEVCDEVVSSIKKFAGLKNALVDKALENLGIVPHGEEETKDETK